MTKRNVYAAGAVIVAIIALGIGQQALDNAAQAQSKKAPMFEVDPFWPKPLPNHWILGATIGIDVDSRDHVYIIHRRDTFNERTEIGAATDPVKADCCIPAPNVLEFDPDGNLVNHWGGPGEGYTWPASNHGITVDHKDNIWIGGNGRTDSHILKFTRDGKFLAEYGTPGSDTDSHSSENFGSVAEVSFDARRQRSLCRRWLPQQSALPCSMPTLGKLKRYWGAYGNEPDDTNLGPFQPGGEPAQQFRNPVHCAQPSNDGLVYVCDRVNNRCRYSGRTAHTSRRSSSSRTAWATDRSGISRFRRTRPDFHLPGRWHQPQDLHHRTRDAGDPDQFRRRWPQSGPVFCRAWLSTDSKGNIYTTETYEGKRVQKFTYKGMGPVTVMDQGTPWPSDRK